MSPTSIGYKRNIVPKPHKVDKKLFEFKTNKITEITLLFLRAKYPRFNKKSA